jgi:hypothetical protein
VIACINIVWVAAIINYDEVISRYLPELQRTRIKLETGLQTNGVERSRIPTAIAD